MRFLIVWMIAAIGGCAHAPAGVEHQAADSGPPTSEPMVSDQRLAVSQYGFCQILRDGSIRCRETQREQPSYYDAAPDGRFTSIVSYHRGYCALGVDGHITCWKNMGSTFQDGVKFDGTFTAMATDNLQVCALDVAGALWCARPANDKINEHFVDAPAIRLADGPYKAVFDGTGICALAEDRADCLWPTYPFSHQPRRPDEHSVPNTKFMATVRGKFVKAIRTRESSCGLGVDGTIVCEHNGRYPDPPKQTVFKGQYDDIVGQRWMCAKPSGKTHTGGAAISKLPNSAKPNKGVSSTDGPVWECEQNVEGINTPLAQVRVFMNMNPDRLAGLTPDGRFVGYHVPENLRGGFTNIYGFVGACAVRADDTVFCEWPNYDDDALRDVTTIESSESEFFTDKGKFAVYTAPRFQVTDIHGKLDERNAAVKGYAEVQHGNLFGCGLKADGTLKCWLTSEWKKYLAKTPVKKFKNFALGQVFGCGITPEDNVKCWGDDYFGAVTNQPDGKFSELRTTRLNVCAVRDDQQILCWGQAFPELFLLPFKTQKWAMTGEGICGIDGAGDVQCFGMGFAWTRPDDPFVRKPKD